MLRMDKPENEKPSMVYMVVHEYKAGNEPGSVLSIWTEKEKASKGTAAIAARDANRRDL